MTKLNNNNNSTIFRKFSFRKIHCDVCTGAGNWCSMAILESNKKIYNYYVPLTLTLTVRLTLSLNLSLDRYLKYYYVRKQLLLSARLSHRKSVHPSVCLSVTRVDQSKTVQARITKFSLTAARKTLVSGTVKLFHKFAVGHPE